MNNQIQERNIVVCIILSLVTCGIYGIYWMYCLAEDVRKATNDQSLPSGGMFILLSIVTCSIYTWFWYYKIGKEMKQPLDQIGKQGEDRGIIYLVLAIFGLGIVNYCLIHIICLHNLML